MCVLCMHVQLVFMCAHTFFMPTHPCSSVHTDACLSIHIHIGTLSTHIRDLRVHIGTQKIIFWLSWPFSPISLSNCDPHAFFSSFCRSCPFSRVGAVLVASFLGIGLDERHKGLSTRSWLRAYYSLASKEFCQWHLVADMGWEVVGNYSHLSHCS